MPSLSLIDLLNPAPSEGAPEVDIHVELSSLASLVTMSSATSILVPPRVATSLLDVLAHVEARLRASVPVSPTYATLTPTQTTQRFSSPRSTSQQPILRENVPLNRQTTLLRLYQFENVNALIEYPESALHDPVGYLFRQDLTNWRKPWLDTAYSLGAPSGGTKAGEMVKVLPLHAEGDENRQGVKVCPSADLNEMKQPHTTASRQDIEESLSQDMDHQASCSSPSRDIFEKTAALITAFRRLGCNAPCHEPTDLSPAEKEISDELTAHHMKIGRGYTSKIKTCAGRLSLEWDRLEKPYIA
ncbi:hypothetical protein C0993_000825 [Termitomyces sp. T159_Od127]|nr:hypothetical protein C0993_000825 [Termitomyces sp. T159_Od127]